VTSKAKKRTKGGTQSPAQIEIHRAANAVLDAALPVIRTHHDLAITESEWRKRNKRAAVDLHAIGKTPEQVAAALRTAYKSEYYSSITMLAKLQEHWPKLSELRSRGPTAIRPIREENFPLGHPHHVMQPEDYAKLR
jgi:hypothetical protein